LFFSGINYQITGFQKNNKKDSIKKYLSINIGFVDASITTISERFEINKI